MFNNLKDKITETFRDTRTVKYIYVFILIAVLVIFLILFFLPGKYNIFISQAKNEFTEVSRLFSGQIDNFFEQEYSKLKLICDSQYIRIPLFQYMISRRRSFTLKKYLKRILDQNDQYEAVILFTSDNIKIAHSSRRRFDFSKINNNRNFHLFQNDQDKNYYFYLVENVKNNFNNNIGVLAVIYSYEVISLLGRNYTIDKFGTSFIIDDKGTIIYHYMDPNLINKSWLNYDLSSIQDNKFFMHYINGRLNAFSISKCRAVPFYSGIMKEAAEFIRPYNSILLIISLLGGIPLIILILNLFLFPASRPGGVKLYDSYMENLSVSLTQMAKATETASKASQLAYETLKNEVDAIKTILNDFYLFMDKRGPSLSELKGESRKEIVNDKDQSTETKVEEGKTEKQGIEVKKEPSSKNKASEPVFGPGKKERPGRKKKKQDIKKTDLSKLPSRGLLEDNGIIIEGEIDKEELKKMDINSKLIILAKEDLDINKGLIEQDGQIIIPGETDNKKEK
ncbi:MAG: cache domain-containing protein [Spirochaetes bacterium]|nr:cache domain-containing protein [Spirochaetota bacterium]